MITCSSFKTKQQIVALIPAAGIGERMKINYPKQYLTIAGKTIIEYTLSIFLKQSRISRIFIILNKNDTFFNKLPISKNPMITTVIGGSKRSYSVLSGLNHLMNNLKLKSCWVLIHDAVRPYLNQNDLNNIIDFIDNKCFPYGGILAAPVSNTIKQSLQGKMYISHTINRNELWYALTPQFFPLFLVKKCLTKALKKNILITDEASALEYCGYHPKLLRGRVDNFKITQPEDLELAEFYLSRIL